jgi:hypothetical protein
VQRLPNPSCGWLRGGRRRSEALTHRLSSVLSHSQVYTVEAARVFYTFPGMARWGQQAWREKGKRKVEKSQGSKGHLQGTLALSNSSQTASSCVSQRQWQSGRERAGGRGIRKAIKLLQLPVMCPHLCSIF